MFRVKTLFLLGGLLLTGSRATSQDTKLPLITRENAAQVSLMAQVGGDRIFDVDWSPDGTLIAVFGQNSVSLYDSLHFMQPARVIEALPFDENVCGSSYGDDYPCRGSVTFRDDGRRLIVGSDMRLRVYDVATGERTAFYSAESEVSNLAYHQGRDMLVTGGNAPNPITAIVRDFSTIEANGTDFIYPDSLQSQQWGVLSSGLSSASFSPNGRFLATSYIELMKRDYIDHYEREISLYDLDAFTETNWDNQELTPAQKLDVPTGPARQIVFSPDSRLLASAGLGEYIYLWDIPEGTQRATLSGHWAAVWDVMFSPQGDLLASGGWDATVRLWDMKTHEQQLVIDGLETGVTSVDFNPDGTQVVAGSWDGSLWIFDAATGNTLFARPGHPGTVWRMAMNPEGTLLAVGNDNAEVVLYDVLDEAPYLNLRSTLKMHRGAVNSLVFRPDGKELASVGADGRLIVWDVQTEAYVKTYASETFHTLYDVVYSPDGSRLLVASDGGYLEAVYNILEEPSYESPYVYPEWGYTLAFDPQETMIAFGDAMTTVLAYNDETFVTYQAQRIGYEKFRPVLSKMTFSRDGTVLLNGAPSMGGSIWTFKDGIRNPEGAAPGVLALSPDGSLMAGHNLSIYDTETSQRLLPPENPEAAEAAEAAVPVYFGGGAIPRSYGTRDAIFSPAGTRIITVDFEGRMRVWAVPTS